jgi:hypothetical protein
MMFARKPLALALIVAGLAMPLSARADEAALQARVDALEAQLRVMQEEMARIRQETAAAKQTAETAKQTADGATVTAKTAAATSTAAAAAAATSSEIATAAHPNPDGNYTFPQIGPNTVLSSYGEIQYNQPRNGVDAVADVGRFVIALEHRFDDKTKMAAEFEVEHAVSSADDRGEAEVEQAYVEHLFTDNVSGKAGLFLIPVGLLNEHHEPTAYYGVYRNFVETSIIPTTWREIGLSGEYRSDEGLTLQGGLTTGFDLAKWDPNSEEGRESPLGSIHQEGQLARARDLSVFGSVNWRGIPGLLVGGTIFYGGAGQGVDFPGSDSYVTLYEGHVRWTPGPWDLSALYARGEISNTAALNATFAGAPTPVPSAFDGWYVQAAYKFGLAGDQSIAPFVRYENFNTALSYVGLPLGFGVPPGPDNKVTTLGLSYWLNPGVVFKVDYQWFTPESEQNRISLGVGYSF